MKKQEIASFEKYRFYENVKDALHEQEEYGSTLKEDLRGIKHHGGLGWKFLTLLKIFAVFAVITVAGLWVYIYYAKPALTSAYSISVVVLGITISVLYWRKVTDDQML